MDGGSEKRNVFLRLKSICVPLLASSQLENRSIPKVLSLLDELIRFLQELDTSKQDVDSSTLSYIFFPLSTILSRNEPTNIPDRILEKVFTVLELLFRWWWWTCDEAIWEQVFKLAGAIIGAGDGKGKGKDRDEETKEAAAKVLLCLLQDRNTGLADKRFGHTAQEAAARFQTLQDVVQAVKFVSVAGITLNSLLLTATSAHLPLQLCSLELIETLIGRYIPNRIIPTILPGVVSTMTKVALGHGTTSQRANKGWVKGIVVAAALRVLDVTVTQGIGDSVCLAAGLVKDVLTLEDLTELVSDQSTDEHTTSTDRPYETQRTASWLRGTSSQLLIAMNTLTPLVNHPKSAATIAFASLSSSLLSKARLTLPNLRPLLLSFLLSLSTTHSDSVRREARRELMSLISPSSKGKQEVLNTLLQSAADSLAALPHLLHMRDDLRLTHLARQVDAICKLGIADDSETSNILLPKIKSGVGKLLGPTGHVEKWGWGILSALVFTEPSIAHVHSAQNLIENDLDSEEPLPFPEVLLKSVSSRETHVSLERMLRSLGEAGDDACLVSVEWFISNGTQGTGSNAVAALWCSCRILEGIAGVSLHEVPSAQSTTTQGPKLQKFSRWLTKVVSSLWDKMEDDDDDALRPVTSNSYEMDVDAERPMVEFTKGVVPLQPRLDKRSKPFEPKAAPVSSSPVLHKAFSLQLLCIAASILRSRFNTLLLHALYPVLHSLVQPSPHLSSTAQSSLQYIASCAGYASPANLLLANFDYALDSVSRRLTRRWLDIDATKVLVILVRLVGQGIVERAGDVVEECFDRLDDFHGYELVVEGLVEALYEVIKVIEAEAVQKPKVPSSTDEILKPSDIEIFKTFVEWLEHRGDAPKVEEDENVGYVPREALGKGKSKAVDTDDDKKVEQAMDETDPLAEPAPTPTQVLTKQIVTRSIYLLTHGSPSIRARILNLLTSAVPVLNESALLPSIHKAWPFIVNRLTDTETYVVSATAGLVEALTTHVGSFMTRRVWDDVWPRFKSMLARLDEADDKSALARRSLGLVGTESAYTHSHRLYRSMLCTMTAAASGEMRIQNVPAWEVMTAFRRFLQKGAHEELQACARQLYVAFGHHNEDAVWLVLTSTASSPGVPHLVHLREMKWDIQSNVDVILACFADKHASL